MFSKAIVAGISAIALTTIFTSSAFADTVRLRSEDGTVDILGKFISYENELYNVQTTLGPVLFYAAQYYCIGAACPVDAVQPVAYVAPITAPTNIFVRVN